jgi:hypothetical protein
MKDMESNIDSLVTKAIKLAAADVPPTPQLDRIVNQSIPDPPTLVCNGKLPVEDQSPNQTPVERTTVCDEVYGLFSGNAEETINEGKAERVNNPNEYMYKNKNSAIAKGKHEHTDANVFRNIEVRSLTLEIEGGKVRDRTLKGRYNV